MGETLYLHWIGEDGVISRAFGPFAAEEGTELDMGRDEACAVVLPDRSVSRRHGLLRREGGAWIYEDLGSRYGSELDGRPLEEPASLRPGARLGLGRVTLALAEAPPPDPDRRDEDRRYRVLLEILELTGGDRSRDEILRATIALAGRAVSADRGFLLLLDEDSGRWNPESLARWEAGGAEGFADEAVGRASETVLREATQRQETVFLRFAAEDPRFEGAESIRAESIQSVICCPLLLDRRAVGAFYVDRRHEGGRPFDEADRELLETVAGEAARVIEKEALLAARARHEKLALLGTLVGRVTHELKNPLYNIRGTAETLRGKVETLSAEEIGERLDRILAGVDRAERNMTGLLGFARPSEKPRQPVDLARALTAAAVETAPRLRELGATLARDYPKGRRVLGQAEALSQVFANLLVNAAQAMEGGGEIRLSLETLRRLGAEEDNWVEVHVDDAGPGIPPENLEKIFEDFFTTKAGRGGSGLGLAICRQIVEEHRGSLRAENREGGGARLTVGLPLHDLTEGD